jgi:hypothetical protein
MIAATQHILYMQARGRTNPRTNMKTMHLKVLSSALGIAALVATPVYAKSPRARAVAAPAYAAAAVAPAYAAPAYAAPAYAAVPGVGINGGVTSSDRRMIGTDPDPNVRFELRRDAWVSDY